MSIQVAKVRDFGGHSQAVYTLCLGVDDDTFYSSGADGMVVKWNLNQTDGELIIKFTYAIYSLYQFENFLLCGGSKGELTIYNLFNKSIERQIQFDGQAIFDIVRWNDKLLVAHGSGMLSILSKAGTLEKQIQISTKSLRKMVLHSDDLFLTGSEGMIWHMNARFEILKSIKAHDESVFAMEYNTKKGEMLTGGRDALLKIWKNFGLEQTINAHWFHINFIALNTSQNYFVTCSLDKSIKIWNAKNNELLKVINNEKYEAHQSSVNKILWIGINRFISCSDDRMIMCFEIQQK